MNKKNASFAVYRNRGEIISAVNELSNLGFERSSLEVFQPKPSGFKDFGQVQKCQLKMGTVVGTIIGVLVAGTIFLVVTARSVESSPLIIILAIFLGAFFGGAAGTLVGVGTPDPAAKRYGQYLQSGGILFSVHSNDAEQLRLTLKVLSETGGQDIHTINELKTWDTASMEQIQIEGLSLQKGGPLGI